MDDYGDDNNEFAENYGEEPELEEEEEEEEKEEEENTNPEKKTENIEEEIIIQEDTTTQKNYHWVENKKSRNFMTKFEYARLISVRAHQIQNNKNINPNVPKHLINPLDIAEYELNNVNNIYPFFVLRPVGDPRKKMYERWKVRDLILPLDKITYGL